MNGSKMNRKKSRKLSKAQCARRRRLAIKRFCLTNHATPILLNGCSSRHDESLHPFHALTGWDNRCEACRAVQVYLKALDEKLLGKTR